MGSIFKRKGKTGVSWYIGYYVNGRQIKEKVGRQKDGVTERMAREALKSREGDIAQKKFNIAQTKTYPCFDKALDEYLAWSKAHKRSYERDSTSSKHLRPFFGNKRINDINPWLIEKYKIQRKEEIKAKHEDKDEKDISFASINRELSLLKHFYSTMAKWGKIDHNPVKGVKMFKERTVERYLEKQEIQALLKACRESKNQVLKAIVETALNTGMRLREILYLRVEDLDFKNSIINIEHTKNGDRGKVSMTEYLRAALTEHLGDKATGYVFCDKDGEPFNEVRVSFEAALDKAGIKNFRFHDLRHTFASQLALNGVDLYTIQRLGRWKTLSMVQRYAHLSKRHQQNAINALGGLFENNPESIPNSNEHEERRVVAAL